ncbi:hypothetical protein F442_21995 [Phytophthora nicotianae P10297]|uniref:Uncharacterized protein n=1 Tax=Phytophthora nicotianae P10297 TaxID=1317064 RepID=W2Y197_PHYNI|nr:hypothetical protein F442_21995 [Phytophthora nicotianae P10297]
MMPAAFERTPGVVATRVNRPKISSVLISPAVPASWLFAIISFRVSASCTRSLFDRRILLSVTTILLFLASIRLMKTPTGTIAPPPRSPDVMPMVWSDVIRWSAATKDRK